MPMIEFANINSFDAGQRESFEELVCVLAKREIPESATTFQRIEGSGGDGGVEAIWNLEGGGKIGFQSKFFPKLGSSQWTQIDTSVRTAMEVHPELKKYIVALPCNLSNKRTATGNGTSGWEKWEHRVSQWMNLAHQKDMDIEFEVWTATGLRDKLLQEKNSPLVEYWFGEKSLNDDWFRKHIDVASQMLDDRFNSDDHVEVSIESVFDAMVRGSGLIQRITDSFSRMYETRVPNFEFSASGWTPDPDVLETAANSWNEVVSQQSAFPKDFSRRWDLSRAKSALENLREAVSDLEIGYLSMDRKRAEKNEKSRSEQYFYSLQKLKSSCTNLYEILEDKSFLAESTQWAILYGPAGAGKSHVLGRIAEQRIKTKLPTLLLLGQDFSHADLWEQIGCKLGFQNRTEEMVLGALSAAGERKGVRTLILIDAINEGAGAIYWRQRLLELSVILGRYPYLAVVVSCRKEYMQYAIPPSLNDSLPKFRVNGFSSLEEMERAAIRYLDRKGIAHPNTPWFSPEFRNPLFLKCVSESLKEKGETEFPKGLHGISGLIALYLDALPRRTFTSGSAPSHLANSVRQLVNMIAGKMAQDGRDFVELDDATEFAKECFSGIQPPSGESWLEVCIGASLFRRDPPPFVKGSDPLKPAPERIRFAFQRFQDHLMAQSLIENIKPDQTSAAFEEGGPLNFIFHDGNPDNGISHKHVGLIGSLSTIYPEILGVEFATTLPNWEQNWNDRHLLQVAFGQSCRWRRTDAFHGQTLELFRNLNENWVDPLNLILDVSMSTDHPWNAFHLHSRLINLDMPQRDHHWTRWINLASKDNSSQANRIVSWALSSLNKETDVHHLQLASLVLAWCLSSSHITLRDRATKALTSIFLKNYNIFPFLLEKISDCDDPYVIERVYAAGFGTCCIDQNPERLHSYSLEVYRRIFANSEPPVALLTRDYALGIIELANSYAALSSEVQLSLCYPPFHSSVPDLDLTKEEVEQLAEDRGDDKIFRSASSEWGDFGKYSIPGRVNPFIATPLSEPKPLPNSTRKHLFIERVISPFPDRAAALAKYEEQLDPTVRLTFLSSKDEFERKEAERQMLAHGQARKNSRERLEALLNPEELKQLSKEYFRDGYGYGDYESVSEQQCRLWVTKRAYDLGWSAELFPHDGKDSSNSRYHNDLERIGKKYQRIALDEIQARLADNFWVLQGWPQEPCVYQYSDEDFRRNLEPTILPTDSRHEPLALTADHWLLQPTIILPEVDEDHLKDWPFEEDPTEAMGEKLLRNDEQGNRWFVLYEHNSNDRKYEPTRGDHGMRYQEFRFFHCIFLTRGTAGKFVEEISNGEGLDGTFFEPQEFTDGPYLREAFWRNTWKSEKFGTQIWDTPDACKFAIPVARYHWESHLDKSLPDGFTMDMPQMWFAQELDLSLSSENPQMWQDASDNCVIQTGRLDLYHTVVVMDENKLKNYLKKFDVEPVWIMIAERNTWPEGHNQESCWRRSTGVIRLENGSWNQIGWNRDTIR